MTEATFPSLIVIGASTGGVRALHELFQSLPPLNACLVVVQHMPAFIMGSFVTSLSEKTPLDVKLAADGDELKSQRVFVIPGDRHGVIEGNGRLRITETEKVNFVRPSIDVTLLSLGSGKNGQRLAGVILTGMGRDGAKGLAHIKTLGAKTYAQKPSTCAVAGMPQSAIDLGCVDHILPPASIAASLGVHFRS